MCSQSQSGQSNSVMFFRLVFVADGNENSVNNCEVAADTLEDLERIETVLDEIDGDLERWCLVALTRVEVDDDEE